MTNAIRPLKEEDYGALLKLQESVWFPLRSAAGWRWLIQENPDQGDLPGGLVYADDENGKIDAFVGMIRLGFMRAGQPLFGGFGHTLIARADSVGAGLRISARAAKLFDGFGVYTLNNNELSVAVYKAVRGAPLHTETATKSAYWVTNHMLYARSGLERRVHSAFKYRFATSVGERMTRINPLPEDLDLPDHVERVTDPLDFHQDREDFAARLAAEDFITTRRDHLRIKWRLSDPDQRHPPFMWTFNRGDGVEGWLIARITKESEVSAPALSVLDLISLSTATADALPALVNAARVSARAMGLARLVLPHYSPETASALADHLEDGVVRDAYPHAHIIGLDFSLEEIEKYWRHTPWDGDYFFALRQPSVLVEKG